MILLPLTFCMMLVIPIFQYKNWRDHSDGNGADKQRIALMCGSLAGLGTCIGVFISPDSFGKHLIAWSVDMVPWIGLTLYGAAIKRDFAAVLEKIKSKLK